MRNLESLISEISRVLDSTESPTRGYLDRLARWYANEVDHFNQTVEETLERVLEQPEATRGLIVEWELSLSDWHGLIAFDRATEWREYLRKWHCLEPPSCQTGKFEMLRSRLKPSSVLETLLEQQRLLVLGEGPAFARHAVLLRLSRLEPDPWKSDLLDFEKHRFNKLSELIERAARNFDKQLTDDLLDEINQTQWQLPIPEKIRRFATEKVAEDYSEKTEYRLNQLAQQMLDHFDARRWQEANSLKKEWKRLYAEAESTAREKMSSEIQEVLTWVETDSDAGAVSNKVTRGLVGMALLLLLLAVAGLLWNLPIW